MTQFYCKYAHIQCASVCEENDELLTFTDSATHFVRSATGGTVRGGGSGRHLLQGGKLLIKNTFLK